MDRGMRRGGVLAGLVVALATLAAPASAAPAPAGRAVTAATAWKIQRTPDPKNKQGRLNAVSCISPSACTSVGSFDNVSGTGTLAERWDGTSWSIQASPNPAGALTSVLLGVSCPAAAFCVAVGNYRDGAGEGKALVEAWNGSSWSVMPASPPAGARRSFLNGVSCTSTAACTAVGSYQTRSGKHVTLAEHWDGTTWSVQATPNPASPPRSALTAVSCISASDCTAVGNSGLATGSNSRTLAEAWDGTSWSIEPTPNGTGGSFLTGVSCASPGACTAVGATEDDELLAEAWNGTSWSIQATPSPGGGSPQFSSVSCTSPSACTAVGRPAFAERWDGTTWSIQQTPVLDANADLTGVACTTASACTAAGQNLILTLGEAWDGTSWSVEPTPNPPALLGQHTLTAVSCTSPSACMAVGFAPKGLTGIATLAERWDGTTWTIEHTPSPDSQSNLFGVSCTSARDCMAVGESFTGGTLAEHWNGTAWSLLKTPNPAQLGALLGVSCTSASACTAVGRSGNNNLTLAEVWNGTSWKIQPTPNPAHSDNDVLGSVSCTSPSACTAVGDFTRPSGQVSLAERWNGTSWSVQPTPNPPGSGNTVYLPGVSCTSGSTCTAVGSFHNSAGLGGTLAEAWNGTSWSIQPTPALPPQDSPALGSISCTSASACTAVGLASGPLAESWNGTSWSVQPTPAPAHSTFAELESVSCVSAGACTAVGQYGNSTGTPLTFAEARP
jgi:hypothetical protein